MWMLRLTTSLFLALTSAPVALATRIARSRSKLEARVRDCGKLVAGPAHTSPDRHSVPHCQAATPRRAIAGAGPFLYAPPWLSWPTFSSRVSRPIRSFTRSRIGCVASQNGIADCGGCWQPNVSILAVSSDFSGRSVMGCLRGAQLRGSPMRGKTDANVLVSAPATVSCRPLAIFLNRWGEKNLAIEGRCGMPATEGDSTEHYATHAQRPCQK